MSIVSIAEELRGQQLRQVLDGVVRAYAGTFEDLKRFAVDWDEAATGTYRSALTRLNAQASGACRAGSEITVFEESVRHALEAHKSGAEAFLARLRDQLRENAAALQQLVTSLTVDSGDTEQKLNDSLSSLRRAAQLDDLNEVRRQILTLSDTLKDCVVGIKRQNSLVIAQLSEEINLLHRRIDQLQSPAKPEEEEAHRSKESLTNAVDKCIAGDRPFSLLLVRVQNLDARRSDDGAAQSDDITTYCLQRIAELDLPISHLGAWNARVLGALIAGDCSQVNASLSASRQLNGIHSLTVDGVARSFNLRVNTALLHRPQAESRERTFQRLGALLNALGASTAKLA